MGWLPRIPVGVDPGWYYLCVGASVLITAVSKTGFGGGIGIVAIPLMAHVMGAREMLGVMLPLLLLCDALGNLHYLGHYDWGRLRWLLPGALAGVAVGTGILLLLRGMPPARFNHVMMLVVGVLCLAIVAVQAWRLTGCEVPTLPPHPVSTASVGLVAGAVSTVNNAAGPIVTLYFLQERLEKRVLVGTMLLYTLLINSAKIPTYLWVNMPDGRPLIHWGTVQDSIWFLPLIPVGTVLGAWMNKRVPERPFAAIVYVVAGVSAAHMVYAALR
jgi:uncharacterized membrane protein YfcA